eukprot:169238-Alexandrium_andersonii.AAC.1
MSASLVGSEMCIRDSPQRPCGEFGTPPTGAWAKSPGGWSSLGGRRSACSRRPLRIGSWAGWFVRGTLTVGVSRWRGCPSASRSLDSSARSPSRSGNGRKAAVPAGRSPPLVLLPPQPWPLRPWKR